MQGRQAPVVLTKHGCIVAGIVNSGFGIPQHGALDARELLTETVLGSLLVLVGVLWVGILHGALYVLANKEGTTRGMPVPPFNQRGVVGCLVAYLPIDLGHAVVEPAVVDPQQHVGIEVVVVLQTVGLTAYGRILGITVDAEGRDAHLDPGFSLMDGLVELLDEEVDVVAAPVTTVAYAIVVGVILGIVGDGLTGCGIGIEIVVHVDAIHVVTADDVLGYSTDIVAVLGNARIKDGEPVVRKATLGMLYGDVVGGQHRGALGLGTVGIDPGVELHTAGVTLLNHPLQGVPIGLGCPTLLTCQETAPGLDVALVEGVTLGTYLENDGVDTGLLQLVELIDERLLHLLC